MDVFSEFTFESAHFLPNVPEGHKCARLHGHSFHVAIRVGGIPDAQTGMVIDFAEIKSAFSPLLAELDHHLLNDIHGLENPTSENICQWIWTRLETSLNLTEVVVRETQSSGVSYRGGLGEI
jgi:6-pyruvoyltetrahydropterin/6-carboxytetrahydropterin synthase